MLILSYKCFILIVGLHIKDYKIVSINLIYLKFAITIKCLKTIMCNRNVLNIYVIIIVFIKYLLYENAHNRTISIFVNVMIFLKIECTNLDVAPISPLLS